MVKLSLLAAGVFLFSCAPKSGPPDWVYHFKAKRGQVCGVGSAGVHMRGWAYQRATAIARAIDEIARQKGVTVNVQVEKFMQGTSEGGAVSALSVYSVQTTEGETIRARVKETYYDKNTRQFYVLMCEEK